MDHTEVHTEEAAEAAAEDVQRTISTALIGIDILTEKVLQEPITVRATR